MTSRGIRSVAMAAAPAVDDQDRGGRDGDVDVAAQAVSRVEFAFAFGERHGPPVGAPHAGQCLPGRDGAAGQVLARLDPQPRREPDQGGDRGDLGQVIEQHAGPVVALGEAGGAEAGFLFVLELPDTGMGVGAGDVQPQGDWGSALRAEVALEERGGGAGAGFRVRRPASSLRLVCVCLRRVASRSCTDSNKTDTKRNRGRRRLEDGQPIRARGRRDGSGRRRR